MSDSFDDLNQTSTTLHWFRMHCLRLDDNPALLASLQQPRSRFRAVFVLDSWFTKVENSFSVNKWRFLLECLHDLDKQLSALNQRLYVVKGSPVAVLSNLCKKWNVNHFTYQASAEPRSTEEERVVDQMAAAYGIKVEKFQAHTLFDPVHVLKLNNYQPVVTLKEFKSLIPRLGNPILPLSPPVPKSVTIEDAYFVHHPNEYRIPTLEDLGFSNAQLYTNYWIGGEKEALRRLPIYCECRSTQPASMVDALLDKSALSPYVKFGCISVRRFWYNVKHESTKNKKYYALVNQITNKLLHREFFITAALQVPNFDSSSCNKICIPLPWHNDRDLLHLWQSGRTGYPWIDAGIRQMLQEGWAHDIIR